MKIIRFEGNFITIFGLQKLKSTKIDYKEIEGFPTSELYFGRYLWKSKSIVIYTKTKKTIEILNSYNSSFEKFEFELRKRKVKYYGFEEYNTGWYFREYKFNRK